MNTPVYLDLNWQNSNAWVLVRLCQTKIWRKRQIMLHGYKQLYSLHKSRRYLLRHFN